MMRVHCCLVAVWMVLVGCATVFGQAGGLPAGVPPGAEALMGQALAGPPLIAILFQKPVQAELKLEQSQKQRIDAIQGKLKALAIKHMAAGTDPATLLAEFALQKKATDQELKEILSEEQMVRLKQVALQMQGPQAVLSPEFAAEMQFSEEQVAKIKRMKRRDDKTLAAIMTKEQRAVWHEKIGRPIKGKGSMPPGTARKPQK